MAINPSTQYPGKIIAPSAAYPYGKAQNITVPGDGTGTPWEAALLNDVFGFQQALLGSAFITPSGSPDDANTSEYFKALAQQAQGRAFTFNAAGTNTIALTVQGGQQAPVTYFTGMIIKFKPQNTNTGAATVNLVGLGAKSIKDVLGNDIQKGTLINGKEAICIYDGVNFIIQNPTPQRVLLSRQSASASATINFIDVFDNAFYEYELCYHGVGPSVSTPVLGMDLSDNSGSTWVATSVATLSDAITVGAVVDGNLKMFGAPTVRSFDVLGTYVNFGNRGTITGGTPALNLFDSFRVKFGSGNIANGEFFLYGVNKV